jgi:large subunit ribosomal protein L21
MRGESMPLQAVVQTGGKQYRVKAGDVLDVELLDAAPGAQVTLTDVRFLSDGEKATSDKQALAGARVVAEVESVQKAPKIVVGKFKAKTHYRRKTGHRQQHTRIRVKEVVAG